MLGLHAIVLIGAGKGRNCYFYHFLNSHGGLFCMRICKTRKVNVKVSRGGLRRGKAKKFVGGFGKVRAQDILLQPVEILRYPDPSVRNEFWVPRVDRTWGDIDDLKMNVLFRPYRTRFPKGG
uniref:Uncharacterized protein n=1 Tax=Arundo donax TaxID=35708 RepID=A0A0A8XTU5_ARUDO